MQDDKRYLTGAARDKEYGRPGTIDRRAEAIAALDRAISATVRRGRLARREGNREAEAEAIADVTELRARRATL
jgi:hypothetical protein